MIILHNFRYSVFRTYIIIHLLKCNRTFDFILAEQTCENNKRLEFEDAIMQ